MFSPKNFTVLALMVSYVIYLELIFVSSVKKEFSFIILRVVQAPFVEKFYLFHFHGALDENQLSMKCKRKCSSKVNLKISDSQKVKKFGTGKTSLKGHIKGIL